MPAGHEADALIGAFPVVARSLSEGGGTVERALLLEEVGHYLREQWGLAPGPAQTTAREVLVFWDESGIFVARGQNRLTSPRLQLLLEIGAAMEAASRPEQAGAFIESVMPDAVRRETLILAAGLSPAIAEAFAVAASASRDTEVAHAAATAVQQGAQLTTNGITALVNRVLADIRAPDYGSWAAAKVAEGSLCRPRSSRRFSPPTRSATRASSGSRGACCTELGLRVSRQTVC